jgi:2,4-dienoyl-CoA reductase-like NADH-dependent reductase (Old Yellow Enzyme family)/NADPH-dependent 2,4-dienoyl-CoA reductase/sulfur reductase-like enzyme
MPDYSALFQKGRIGPMELKNRLIMAPMGNSLAGADGKVSPAMLSYYKARAIGGAGLIITQFAAINPDALLPYSLCLYDDSYIPGLKELVDTLHEAGSKVSVQLMHPGLLFLLLRKIPNGVTLLTASRLPWLSDDIPYREATEADIERTVEDFAAAAARAAAAGADAVELHACHGCLLSTFLSPATNRREDGFGGNTAGRARFPKWALERVREAVGNQVAVTVRINADDDVPGGVTPDEVLEQARILQDTGADAVSLSSGLEYWSTLMAPTYLTPDGVILPLTARVKKALRVPLIAAGKIGPELAARAVAEDLADFITLGRPLLADADLPRKLAHNEPDAVRRCLHCNNCLRHTWRACTVNPFLYREETLPVPPTDAPKRVLVVGAGLAGLQAALTLAERGHRVTVVEKEDSAGGQWRLAAMTPGKAGFASIITSLERELKRRQVNIEYGVEVTATDQRVEEADIVLVATGAAPLGLPVAGAELPHVVQANDVIQGRAVTGDRVVVIGGRALGLDTAITLAEGGKQVTLVSRSGLGGRKGADEPIGHRAQLRKLVALRVPVLTGTEVLEITPATVVTRYGGEQLPLPADSVVLAVGVSAVDYLADELQASGAEVYAVGDAVQPGNAAQATSAAARLAARL